MTPAEKVIAVKTITGQDVTVNDLTKDDNAKIISLTEKGYSLKQAEIQLTKRTLQANQQTIQKDKQTRIDGSIANLKTSLPDFDEDLLPEIETVLKVKGIGSLFTDKDGKLLPDAAEKVAYVLYGKTLVSSSANSASAKSANAEREKIINANTSAGASAKGKSNNVTKAEEDILKTRKTILDSYKPTY